MYFNAFFLPRCSVALFLAFRHTFPLMSSKSVFDFSTSTRTFKSFNIFVYSFLCVRFLPCKISLNNLLSAYMSFLQSRRNPRFISQLLYRFIPANTTLNLINRFTLSFFLTFQKLLLSFYILKLHFFIFYITRFQKIFQMCHQKNLTTALTTQLMQVPILCLTIS